MTNIAKLRSGEAVFSALYETAVGIDVHEKKMVACYQSSRFGNGELKTEHRDFGTTQRQLEELTAWCKNLNPEIILFESTGVYWVSLYEKLEQSGLAPDKVAVLNGRDVKAVRGRKTDWADAKRLTEIGRYGAFKASFIPSKQVRDLRFMFRSLSALKKEKQRTVNILHKLFTCSGLRASQVFSDIRGKAATVIMNAVIAGVQGAELMKVIRSNCSRLKASAEDIYAALQGDRASPLWHIIKIFSERYQHTLEQYQALLELIEDLIKPFARTTSLLCTIPGIKQITAMGLVCELGDDLSKFTSVKHFCFWLGICPGNSESAGKRYSGKCAKGNKYLRILLIEAAQGVALSKKGALFEQFQTLKERRGHNRAIVAVAHKLAKIIFAVYRDKTSYKEQASGQLKEHRIKRLARAASSLSEVNLKVRDPIILTDTVTEQPERLIEISEHKVKLRRKLSG